TQRETLETFCCPAFHVYQPAGFFIAPNAQRPDLVSLPPRTSERPIRSVGKPVFHVPLPLSYITKHRHDSFRAFMTPRADRGRGRRGAPPPPPPPPQRAPRRKRR